ncbi:PI-PLC domain-containing protein [Mucilaginibacter myungsuensis]|uniref:Glycerophosphodiester phosphodiesterase n=1 Tax=Mucilaginibacter myungsuensis TaxID=649104 RepID=A0A929L1I2_9SPHI|nr:hypothetical protein [Mucilaginibacter myungsuensis]MBE9662385.1 hypothetical protein [Mucilaginibacter myungsuensis]MDN3599178.1 hypothetical protein [Mucilaginibacter myungsuensis]
MKNSPLIIKHRINTTEALLDTPVKYGVELDLRSDTKDVIIHHDAFDKGELLEEYIKRYQHQLIILNTKCEGLEQKLIGIMAENNISNYFFLDLSLPFLVKTINAGCSKVAVRFSEYEPLAFVKKFEGKAEWVWVDCFTKNVLTTDVYEYLSAHFKICIVSPELQGHPLAWIQEFKRDFANFNIDAICTKQPDLWM